MLHVLVGICGGIAAYKAPEYIRQLRKEGYRVTVILTENAEKFVSKLVLEVVSEQKVYTQSDSFSPHSYHLTLSRSADAFILFPATAQTIAKCANGFCEDLLTTTFLSFLGPKAVCPAMHTEMYLNPQTQVNIKKLQEHGVQIIGPDAGDLACGDKGVGRLVDIVLIRSWLNLLKRPPLVLQGKKLLITMGGTREPVDTVRCLSNLSSGKLGQHLALVAQLYGATLTLVTTVSVPPFQFEKVCSVSTSDEMKEAVFNHYLEQNVIIMAAAVSDFKPKQSTSKINRQKNLTLELEGTADILASLPKASQRQVIGFCLADHELEETARAKMDKKGVDVMIANHSSTLGQDNRDFVILKPDQDSISISGATLFEMAYDILDCINS